MTEANAAESVILGRGLKEKTVLGYDIAFGCSFAELLGSDVINTGSDVINTAISAVRDRGFALSVRRTTVYVALGKGRSPEVEVEAYAAACFAARNGRSDSKIVGDFVSKLKSEGFKTSYIQLGGLGWEGEVC